MKQLPMCSFHADQDASVDVRRVALRTLAHVAPCGDAVAMEQEHNCWHCSNVTMLVPLFCRHICVKVLMLAVLRCLLAEVEYCCSEQDLLQHHQTMTRRCFKFVAALASQKQGAAMRSTKSRQMDLGTNPNPKPQTHKHHSYPPAP